MDATDADQPEPSSVASGFAAMQEQFQNMMLMMQADKMENTERFEAMNAAFQSETALLHDEIVASGKTHLGRQTGRKTLSTEPPYVAWVCRGAPPLFKKQLEMVNAHRKLSSTEMFSKR